MNKLSSLSTAMALSGALVAGSVNANEDPLPNARISEDITLIYTWTAQEVNDLLMKDTCETPKDSPIIWYLTIDTLRENKKIPNFTYTQDEEQKLWKIAYNDYLCELGKYIDAKEFTKFSTELLELLSVITRDSQLEPKEPNYLNYFGKKVKDRIALEK